MRSPQPSWNQRFVDIFEGQGVERCWNQLL
jgi:hypothetical protein